MYLVELEAGREELYQSPDALAQAIRRGEVGPRSRIFHRASSSWVSITVHPEYRKATATADDEPLPPMARTRWTFFGAEPGSREIHQPVHAAGAPGEESAATIEGPKGLRGLLRRALGGLAASPKPSASPAD
ncbi:MAG TPA: hypothetical protein VG500_16680 [Gemmatimonadales bacterium]|jgi:hypothetical protein|nr:hypothetical protein [Gemmatimonadales bacterium]